MNSLKDEILAPEEAVQQAYDQSVKTNWTIARQSAALSMGATILNGVFGPELRALQKKGSYSNVLRDVVIVLWLQSLSPEEVIRVNSGLDIDLAIYQAFEWAEKEGIQYGSPKYLDGVHVLTEIVGSVFASFYAVEGDKTKAFKKSIKPPGKSS